MSENNNPKSRGVSLKTPADVRRISQRIISDVFRDGAQIEHAGKVNNLLVTWLKAWELDKLGDIEKRLATLERERK
ncbi:MAG: hypothetical protein WAW52_12620 [Methanothrix sp.]